MNDTPRIYKDADGNPCPLLRLIKLEPEWAENQILHRDKLERELAAVTSERDALQKTTLRLMDAKIATEKERDALVKDKERLDWLELASADEDGHMVKVARFSNGKTDMVAQGKAYHSFLSLRTAIDAALAEVKGVTL